MCDEYNGSGNPQSIHVRRGRRHGIYLLFLACMVLLEAGVLRAQESPQAAPAALDSNVFPLGMFSADGAGAMDHVVKMGLTYVHTYAMGGGNDAAHIARDLAYMDKAHARGLKVMYNLQGHHWIATDHGVAEMLTLVLLAIWRRPAGTFLVAVNGQPQAQPLTCWLENELTEATLQPWGSTRITDTTVRTGRLKGGVARPWEVFIWKVVEAASR